MSFVVTLGSTSISNVRSVQRSGEVAADVWVNTTNNVGRREIQITVDGIIFGQGRNSIRGIAQQDTALTNVQTLEDNLRNEGTATLTFGTQTISNVRLVSLETEEFSNNPALFFTANFAAGSDNPFSSTVSIANGAGSTTLSPTPEVTDEFVRQDETITWATQGTSNAKRFTLSGEMVGSTAQINTYRAELISRLTAEATVTLAISSGSYTAKVSDFEIGTPPQIDRTGKIAYAIELFTEKNYALESENLPHTSITWAGINFDVTSSYSSNIGRSKVSGAYQIESETLSISGEIYFSSFSAAESFIATVKQATVVPNTQTSLTGKTLTVSSVSVGEPEREGRDTSGNQRYRLSVSLSMEWVIDLDDSCVSRNENFFGLDWFCINSKNTGGSVNFCGLKTQDTLSLNGIVDTIPDVDIGSSHSVNGKTYYVTSVGMSGRDKQGRYQISVSARTLDTFETATQFLAVTLPSGEILEELSSKNKSTSYKYNSSDGYRTTSVTMSISGFAYVGNGNADSFYNLIDAASQASGIQLNQFRITNVGIGAKETFIDENNCNIGHRQSISASYVLNFEPDGNASGSPDENADATIVEEESVDIQEITNKYTQIQIPGGDLTFKKTGLNPGKVTITKNRRRVGGNATIAFAYPDEPPTPLGPEELFVSDEKLASTGSTRRRVKEFTILKGKVGELPASPGSIVTVIVGGT